LDIKTIEFKSDSGIVNIHQIEFITEAMMIFDVAKTSTGHIATASFAAISSGRYKFIDEDYLEIPWEIIRQIGLFSFNGKQIRIESIHDRASIEKFNSVTLSAMKWAGIKN